MSTTITHHSGPGRPCPVCGRTADGDCRWGQEVILCHQGQRNGPPEGLRVGDTIAIDGRLWALVAVGGGFDGAAAVFRPHRPLQGHGARPAAPRPVVDTAAAVTLLEGLLEQADAALDAPDFYTARPQQLWPALAGIERAEHIARRAAALLPTIWQSHPDLAAAYAQPVRSALRELAWQADDARRFRRFDLGERRHDG